VAIRIGELLGIDEHTQAIGMAADGVFDFADPVPRHWRSRKGVTP
jgi:hypothetical protein